MPHSSTVTSAPTSAEETRLRLLADGVVLCLRLTDGAGVVEACRAAARGGLRVLELTLTTPGALEALAELARDPALLVGAGTVLAPRDVEAVAAAGGRFALSPVFDADVLAAARAAQVLYVPGAATPTEILAAHRAGAPAVKLFPSGALGGPEYLRRVRGPLPDVPLIPTSGPRAETVAEWVAAGAVAVGVGPEIVRAGARPEEIEGAARGMRRAMDAAREACAR